MIWYVVCCTIWRSGSKRPDIDAFGALVKPNNVSVVILMKVGYVFSNSAIFPPKLQYFRRKMPHHVGWVQEHQPISESSILIKSYILRISFWLRTYFSTKPAILMKKDPKIVWANESHGFSPKKSSKELNAGGRSGSKRFPMIFQWVPGSHRKGVFWNFFGASKKPLKI